MSLSNYAEDKLNDHLNGKTAFTMPTNIYISLHNADPGETGASELSGGSYARQQVLAAGWNASSGGLADNVNAISFASLPADTVVAVGIWDASSAGNFLRGGWLSTVKKPFVCTDLASDLLRSPSHGLAANDRVAFSAEFAGTLPTGLAAGTLYHVIATGLTTDDFKVSTTQGGSAVDLTAVGSGVFYKVIPQVVNAGGTLQFNAGALDVLFV